VLQGDHPHIPGGTGGGYGYRRLDFGARIGSISNKKAVLPQGNRAMPQVFFSVEVRQQHSLQV